MNDSAFPFGPTRSQARRGNATSRSTPTVAITDCDCPGATSSLVEEIMELWRQGATELTLDFGEVNEMPPNSALRLYDLFQRRPPGTKIISMAHSSIIGSGLLAWLAIPDRQYIRRYIRPTAWFHLRRIQSEGRRRPRLPWLDEGEAWKATEAESAPNFMEMDYRTVLRLISGYLPVKDLCCKVLTPALLDEFDLLDLELMKTSGLVAKPSNFCVSWSKQWGPLLGEGIPYGGYSNTATDAPHSPNHPVFVG